MLGQPPLTADEGVEMIVRHVSIVGLALRGGEVLVVHQLRVGRDGPLQERIQIMLMAYHVDFILSEFKSCRKVIGVISFLLVLAYAHSGT